MRCYIFDLDGVVTNLEEKTITNPHIVFSMISFLQQEESVTINTGRSLAFIRREILTPLLEYLKEHNLPQSLLHNFFAIGEKGNAWIEDEKDCFDMTGAVPQEFIQKVHAYIETNYPDTSFDRNKRTMVSVESKKGISLEAFALEKEKITELFRKFLREFHLSNDFVIDQSISAVDIQAKSAGKALGTQRIFVWLTKREVNPDEFIAFGDSPADIGTGEALQKAGKDFTFVFVGNSQLIQNHPSFPIVFTKEHYDKGVIEYFRDLTLEG